MIDDEMKSGILLHWSDADRVTKRNIMGYILNVTDPNKLRLIYDYVFEIS